MIRLAVTLMYLVRISGSMAGSVYATEGETVFLPCSTSPVQPVAPVEWQFRDDIIFGFNGVQNDKYKPRFGLSNSTTLVIYNASVSDSGHYFCFESPADDVVHDISLSVSALSEATSTAESHPTTAYSADKKVDASLAWKVVVAILFIVFLIAAAYYARKLWRKSKRRQLRELQLLLPQEANAGPQVVSVTTTEECCVLGEECRRKRATMPCGHVISAEGLKYMCHVELKKNRVREFRCPECSVVWVYTIVRHVLSTIMSKSSLNKIAIKLSENFLQQRDMFRECPRCKFMCERISAESSGCANPDKVVCVACTIKNNDRPVEFCWRCLRPWASTDGTAAGSACGHADCSVDEVSPENIAAFPDQRMGNVTSAPGIRACPGCSVFVSLAADGYKHVKCAACKLEFCMVCLRRKDGEGRWPCSECDGPCEPAALQPEFLNRLIDILNRPTEQPTANNNNSS